MESYFTKTEVDKRFYLEWIKERIPARIFDVHVHINLKEHVADVTRERIMTDWALECGIVLPCEDAYACAAELYPDIEYRIAGFPWPIREADLKAANAYLAQKKREGKLTPFMCTRPEWDNDYTEKVLLDGGFIGLKPYPDMVSGIKGADISIFDFITREQLGILDKHKKTLLLHLPRKERLADPDNIRELLEIRQKYPAMGIIIAHLGRSFVPYHLDKGLKMMMNHVEGFYFDTSAVINTDVYNIAFEKIPLTNILYGSDLPIVFWHGKREYTERGYTNLCRENYSWNKHLDTPENEEKYTLFIYEQMRAILDAADMTGLDQKNKEAIFYDNACRLLVKD